MSGLWAKAIKHPIWSSVISALIAAAIIAGVGDLSGWGGSGDDGDEPKPLRLLLAIDRSTSMGCPVRGSTPCPRNGRVPPSRKGDRQRRIEAAVNGAADAVPVAIQVGDHVGVWTFNNRIGRGSGIQLVTREPAPVSSELDGLAADVKRDPVGATPGSTHLHDAIYDAVVELRQGWRDDAPNVLVVLTDGKDFGSKLDTQRRLSRKLLAGDSRNEKPIHLLVTAAWDVECDELLTQLTAVTRECFQVSVEDDADAAFDAINERVRQLRLQ